MGANYQVRRMSIGDVVEDLKSIPSQKFTLERIDGYLTGLLLDQSTLKPYLHFKEGTYTRNLVFRNELFEVLVLCWDIGQKTPVHNHRGQLGWMSVQQGMLSILNYKRVDCSGACHLTRRWSRIEVYSEIPIAGIGFVSHVSDKETIHQIYNDPAFQQRAVSLHIYSRPFDSCVVYDIPRQTCTDKRLSNYTEGGELVEPGTVPPARLSLEDDGVGVKLLNGRRCDPTPESTVITPALASSELRLEPQDR